MKHLILSTLFLFTSLLWAEPLQFNIGAKHAILMNADTGVILFEKRAHDQAYPASTTKMATAMYILTLKRDCLSEIVQAPREAVASITPQAKQQSNYRSPAHWLETDGSHIGIKKGEEFPLNDLLHAVLVSSANDASNVVAAHIGPSIPDFITKLNAYLVSLGCHHTHFKNPHGLHHPDHVTTAYDLALMARTALKDPLFCDIIKTPRYTCPQTNLEYERQFLQTNKLIRNGRHHYPYAIGIKTGSTKAAGKNLVAAAEKNGRKLVAVGLGYSDRNELYKDITRLFEAAFNEPLCRRFLLPLGPQSLSIKVEGAKQPLTTYLSEGLYYDFYPAEEVSVHTKIAWLPLALPIQKGQPVALIQIEDNQGTILSETPLLAQEILLPTWWHRIKTAILAHRYLCLTLIFTLLAVVCLKSKKRKVR